MKDAFQRIFSKSVPLISLVLVVAVLAVGFSGLSAMRMAKQEPAHVEPGELVLKVETTEVRPEDVPVTIAGFGAASPIHEVPIAAEVAGVVTEIHPRLNVGEIIPAGELLFRIDQRNYQNALDQAEAGIQQAKSTLERLEQQYRLDQERLATLERSRDLSRDQYLRVKALFEDEDVGTRAGVEQAEIAYNQSLDQTDQLAQAVGLYPARIREAESAIQSAEAQRSLAEANLERTEVRTNFEARLKMVSVKAGQYVTPGQPILTLADDSLIEISLPLDSRDIREWLQFAETTADPSLGWFGEVTAVPCKVYWTEAAGDEAWSGTLHRVERFEAQTRTVSVAVRVDGSEAARPANGVPLVEGMFCRIEIPGKAMKDVYRLPRWAVSFDGQVYVAEDGRLSIRNVEVVRNEDNVAFVRGLSPGEEIITTRVVNPLPNTKLEIVTRPEESDATEQIL